MGTVRPRAPWRKQPNKQGPRNQTDHIMGRLFKVALLLLPLLQVEGKALKLEPKSSNKKEIPQIVANPSDASVIRGERVVLECEAAPRSSVKSCSWSKSGAEISWTRGTG